MSIREHLHSTSTGASDRMDPTIRDAARKSDVPDVSIYDRPATTRSSSANIALSIVVLVVALVFASVLLWMFF